ncbi:sulfotransferase (plasmid) [Aliiroseovarius sp. M344]|uniref:sulfotransferase n=1 Tax=Aliiroseovarius sp. M344 TaxID=2867010 RepID=UPI0021AE065A|nr:sulfotransferase [Aliiroseovarius sp. M344]UWQ16061.1 sulfotransferase [Aliiroseovarius sp. M344]
MEIECLNSLTAGQARDWAAFLKSAAHQHPRQDIRFAHVERALEWVWGSKTPSVCFIVGPPRSGTLLLYEMVVTQYSCGYLSNFAKRMYRTPVVATFLLRKAIRDRSGAFDSTWGELDGNAAPSEAGRIWCFWMAYAAPYHQNARGMPSGRIRRKMPAIVHILGGSVIIKNPILQADIPQLLHLFLEAIFLHIDRDFANNARSLKRLREVREGEDEAGWVSLRPSGWERFTKADPMTQSCAQVVLSHQDIETELSEQRSTQRVLRIAYEDLCAAPNDTLSEFERFARANGVALMRKCGAASPKGLTPRHQPMDETQRQIEFCLRKLRAEIKPA